MWLDNLAYQLPDPDHKAFIDAEECYRTAERRAAEYYKALYQQVMFKSYVPTLIEDFESWKHRHVRRRSVLTALFGKSAKPDPRDNRRYIQWLDHTGKLDAYLERSVSYIFMRDLGKDLSSTDTQSKVRRMVGKLRDSLVRSASSDGESRNESFSMAWLYRKAQKERIESAMIWVMEKLKTVSAHIPEGMDAENAERKLIKIIAGVLMHEMEEMGEGTRADARARKLDAAIRLGYSYGLTYPFIDDLLDAHVLSPEEKIRYSGLIRTALITGAVPELGSWPGKNGELVRYIHAELRDAFECIKTHQKPGQLVSFFEQAYVFFQSQEVDRRKDLSDSTYTNEELYIPIILKSSSSRLIARSVCSAEEDSGFDSRTFYYGIYNQLADDFADMFDDLREGAVTPYTYYLKYCKRRSDLINPFELYWAVISYLIHTVYRSDAKTCEVILDRAVNGLKRYKERMGPEKYNEIMALFTSRIPDLNETVQKMVRKADDVDFFDKLLRDRMITNLKNERAERKTFVDTMRDVRQQIQDTLPILPAENDPYLDHTLVEAANYSLGTDGKRIRPLVAWAMGRDVYGLNPEALWPLLRSLEYMHTASLIFDDLPSQDNAEFRRGHRTLHHTYDVATAELTGLFLTQRAVEEQASLEPFDPAVVLRLIRYSSGVTQSMCKGQEMDLNSKGKRLTLEELRTLCFFKTGIAFEASLIMPAILAGARESEMGALKRFARDAGIAFQIRDDLLDAEGDPGLLGKTPGRDAENGSATFVTILGLEGARKEMWNHYCSAMEALRDIPRNTAFLKQLLNYIVSRNQ